MNFFFVRKVGQIKIHRSISRRIIALYTESIVNFSTPRAAIECSQSSKRFLNLFFFFFPPHFIFFDECNIDICVATSSRLQNFAELMNEVEFLNDHHRYHSKFFFVINVHFGQCLNGNVNDTKRKIHRRYLVGVRKISET